MPEVFPHPTVSPALSPEALRAVGEEAWPLLPVLRHERAGVDWPEAARLVDRLAVKVARASGAIAVAVGECLDLLATGDGPMRLGYSSIGDYAREVLSLPPRTARELAQLARELRTRPALRAAVRAGTVSQAKAQAILEVATGDAEARWVERAKVDTVRALRAAARAGSTPAEDAARWDRVELDLAPEDRPAVNAALEVAGRLLRSSAPTWQRVESICQEYLGSHPLAEEDGAAPGQRAPDLRATFGLPPESDDPLEWLEREHARWTWLDAADPVPAPEAGLDACDRARQVDGRARALMQLRAGWDALLGHLSMLLENLGAWRHLGFRDLDHYAAERLGMSGRAVEQRAWLERRLWELPPLREAMRDGRIGYEQARILARCAAPEEVEAWVQRAAELTVVELSRAFAADEERQMSARNALTLRLPAEVHALFHHACRAVLRAERRPFMRPGECLAVMARHFLATYAAEVRRPNTPAGRAMDRDAGLCTCPGCSKAADHSHHIQFRSHQGSDEEWNRTSLCTAHHLHGVHRGYVRVAGTAPGGLDWELGDAA